MSLYSDYLIKKPIMMSLLQFFIIFDLMILVQEYRPLHYLQNLPILMYNRCISPCENLLPVGQLADLLVSVAL
jgi:hypothetical protein